MDEKSLFDFSISLSLVVLSNATVIYIWYVLLVFVTFLQGRSVLSITRIFMA